MAEPNRSTNNYAVDKCQICGSDTRVLRKDGNERRRECERCRHRFTTVERMKEQVERMEKIVRDAQELASRIIAECP